MTILNETVETVSLGTSSWYLSGSTWSVIGLICTVVGVVITCGIIIHAFSEDEPIEILLALLILCLTAIPFCCTFIHGNYIDVKLYEVTIDETVTFHEVMDKYDLIEQRGNIYVLKDKVLKGEEE